MSQPNNPKPKPPTCPDCNGRRIIEAPAESRMTWQCEDCGRTFSIDRPDEQ